MSQNQREREQFQQTMPPQMLDMGMPQELSLDNAENAPIVEVTRPFRVGEGLEEIRSADDIANENI